MSDFDRPPFQWHPTGNDADVQSREEFRQAIDQMTADRGWIVNAFAQVEYLLADTVVRCRDVPAYAGADTSLPYRLDQRVSRFEALIALPGLLVEQRDAFEQIVADFREAEERRQFLVHGFSSFHYTRAGDMAMRFDRFMPTRDEPTRRRSMWFRPKTLADIRREATDRSAFAVSEFIHLHQRAGWIDD